MKRIIIILLISFILFGCTSNSFKINEEIKVKGKVEEQQIIIDGTYKTINVLSLEEPIVIDGTEINKLEINTEEIINNEDTEITGILTKDTISDLSYAINIK